MTTIGFDRPLYILPFDQSRVPGDLLRSKRELCLQMAGTTR